MNADARQLVRHAVDEATRARLMGAVTLVFDCEWCGNELPTIGDRNFGRRRFCSYRCGKQWRNRYEGIWES